MGFCFSKPDKKQLLKESRETVESNARTLSVCMELAEGPLRDEIKKVYDGVRYMTPCEKAGAAQADKKIGALAGDLKILLSKNKDRALVKAEDIVHDISAAIAERNSYTK